MSSELEVSFIQTAWVDAALDDPKSWRTNCPFSFASRADAERRVADQAARDRVPQPRMENLDRDPRVVAVFEQMRAEQSFRGWLRRQRLAMRRWLSLRRDSAEEPQNTRDPLLAVIAEIAAEAERVEQVFRVVSSAELFAEGGEEALLRAREATAVLGALPRDERVSEETKDA